MAPSPLMPKLCEGPLGCRTERPQAVASSHSRAPVPPLLVAIPRLLPISSVATEKFRLLVASP